MACTLCGHTMQNLGVEGQRIFWCPRCGSIKSVVGEYESVTVPLIASRVKVACDVVQDTFSIGGSSQVSALPPSVWSGIAESVGERV